MTLAAIPPKIDAQPPEHFGPAWTTIHTELGVFSHPFIAYMVGSECNPNRLPPGIIGPRYYHLPWDISGSNSFSHIYAFKSAKFPQKIVIEVLKGSLELQMGDKPGCWYFAFESTTDHLTTLSAGVLVPHGVQIYFVSSLVAQVNESPPELPPLPYLQ
jgi:hypothetical protein